MSDMVERVAMRQAGERWESFDDEQRNAARELAKIAIDAMRHIPDEYFSVLVRVFNMRDDIEHRSAARLWYHRMIDEALK